VQTGKRGEGGKKSGGGGGGKKGEERVFFKASARADRVYRGKKERKGGNGSPSFSFKKKKKELTSQSMPNCLLKEGGGKKRGERRSFRLILFRFRDLGGKKGGGKKNRGKDLMTAQRAKTMEVTVKSGRKGGILQQKKKGSRSMQDLTEEPR